MVNNYVAVNVILMFVILIGIIDIFFFVVYTCLLFDSVFTQIIDSVKWRVPNGPLDTTKKHWHQAFKV